MSVKIPVSASFDQSSIDSQLQQFSQKLNALGQQIAEANKVQFEPVSKTSLDELKRITAQFEALKRVSGDLNRRINATGQKGAGFLELDWSQMYPDEHSRARQMAKAFQYVTGHQFSQQEQQPGQQNKPQQPSSPPPRHPFTNAAVNVAQAGLGAAGPMGGVASRALGAGMAGGFSAGIMGLLGGALAMGVGKLVGDIRERIGKAEDNAVSFDTLKRTLGDVNVSFESLRASVQGAAGDVKVTFDEAAKLTTSFTKLGNVAGDQAMSLGGELRTGVEMSRSLGLDPSTGMSFLGTMRGMRATQDEQGSRRMALLIGETIAKSDAFAKSDEVMEAISGYVTAQTRASFGANVEGYAGMFSSMVGSGLAGMDPTNASSILSRINASLSAGGAHGEASQFFTSLVGRDLGLDPLQTQLLREAGAFATADQVFGAGSAYERATGRTIKLRRGDQTFLDASRERLAAQYGGDDERSVLLRAQAEANHFGISMTQALALNPLSGGQMGELESALNSINLNLADINLSGLSAMSKVVAGSANDRMGIATELWGRTGDDALSEEERRELNKIMTSGTDTEQRDLLLRLVATREQEVTQGKDIRDSKVAIENIKTLMAEQLLPVTQSMRDGIMWMAGDGKRTPQQVREDLARLEIQDKYAGRIREQERIYRDAVNTNSPFYKDEDGKQFVGKAYGDRRAEGRQLQIESMQEKRRLQRERDAEVEQRILGMREEHAAGLETREQVSPGVITKAPEGWRAFDSAPADTGVRTSVTPTQRAGGTGPAHVRKFVEEYGPLAEQVAADLDVPVEAVLGQWGLETGWGKSIIPGTRNLGNIKDFSGRGPTAKDNMTGSVDAYRAYDSDDAFRADFTRLLRRDRYSAALGTDSAHDYFTGLKDGGYAEDPNYVRSGVAASNMARRAMGTPLPVGGAERVKEMPRIGFEDINVNVTQIGAEGQPLAPPQQLQTRVKNNFYGSVN